MGRNLNFGFRILLSALIVTACNRNGRDPSSAVAISIPASTLAHIRAAIPAGKTPCFGINITGKSTPGSAANSCSPTMGAFDGYRAAGQDLSVSISPNQTVNLDIYAYLLPSGQTTCPAMTAAFPIAQLANTYLIGTKADIPIGAAPVVVDMTIDFPANGQNLAQTLKMPAACTPVTNAAPAAVSASAGQTTGVGTYLQMKSGISTSSGQAVSGPNLKMIVR